MQSNDPMAKPVYRSGRRALRCLASLALALVGANAAAQDQAVPYWASIKTGDAIAREGATMRAGPSRLMRAMWVYRRPGLPLKVVAVYEDWRQVREQDGTTGWMHRSLLTGRRTAVVTENRAPMRTRGDAAAPVAFYAEQGVVGRVSECTPDWCQFDVFGRRGYIATSAIWGDDRD
jgi:SH3-like domain-containing protein